MVLNLCGIIIFNFLKLFSILTKKEIKDRILQKFSCEFKLEGNRAKLQTSILNYKINEILMKIKAIYNII